MSLNHIIKDTVPDDEKLDVKFGIVEADNMEIADATLENLTVSNNLFGHNIYAQNNLVASIGATVNYNLIVGDNILCSGSIDANGAEPAGHITCNNSSKSKVALFKSKPYLNSNTIGPQSQLQADEIVNGMLIFDDVGKTVFAYKTPYKGDFDDYLGLSGTDEYCFRFDMTIFANMSTGGTYTLECDAVSGVSINYAGTYVKALPHTTGAESTFTFVCCRQSDGTYIIYG